MLRLLSFAGFFLFVSVSSTQQLMQEKRTEVSVSARAKSEHIKAGSPVVIEVKVMNTTGHDLPVVAGPDFTDFEVLDEHGITVPSTANRKAQATDSTRSGGLIILQTDSGSAKLVNMAPGEVWTYEVAIDKLFDFSRSGVYTIRAERRTPGAAAKSSPVKVTITP
jgi:hypothetical protein